MVYLKHQSSIKYTQLFGGVGYTYKILLRSASMPNYYLKVFDFYFFSSETASYETFHFARPMTLISII